MFIALCYCSFRMKLSLVILSLLIFVENHVRGEEKQDDLPDLTLGKPPIPQEELDAFNQLRKDIWKSLNDLKSKMETDQGKMTVVEVEDRIIAVLKVEDHLLTDNNDVEQIVANVEDILNDHFPELIPAYQINISNEADIDKWKEYERTNVPEFRKRLEPFLKYLKKDEQNDYGAEN